MLWASSSWWRVSDVISSLSYTSWRGPVASLEACSGRRGGDSSSGGSLICAEISLGYHRDLRKVTWTIGLRSCEAFPDRQLFVCFSIGNSFGGSGWVSVSYMYFFPKKQTQIGDRSCITLVRCNQVCIWMNIIRKLCNKSNNFRNENVIWIFPDLFYHDFRLEGYVCLESCFDSVGLACTSQVGVSPTVVPANFCPRVGENPSCGVEPQGGGKPYNGVRFAYAFEWGEIPSTELRS